MAPTTLAFAALLALAPPSGRPPTGPLERYEPRLKDVEVIHVKNDDKTQLTLQFQVQARLVGSTTTSWVSFLTRMDPSGRISLRR